MTQPFHYSTSYILDKSHFGETFDETFVKVEPKKAYSKSMILALLGTILLFATKLDPYISWFVIVWSGIEALSVRFHRSWWLARQMISKAANNDLTLTLDEKGVSTQSNSVKSFIAWDDIVKIEQTKQGWLLFYGKGKSYLSNRCLSPEAQEFVAMKV
ncbi:YcxB family protein [Paraglaciecola sp. L3A3]|uniref:YcxB family protein n=1 Tax=Paraglaciecola sp. L3A3 TaxID=2686358 RepID=UPI00131E69C0|nr:YcxB family protein [Paraglaciecola sp. L3A3]